MSKSLMSAINEYLIWRENTVASATVRADRVNLNQFLARVGEETKVSEITTETMDAYLRYLNDGTRTNAYLNKIRSRMISFFEAARRRGWGCTAAVMDNWPALAQDTREKTFVPQGDWSKVLNYASFSKDGQPTPRTRAAVATFLYAAPRNSEVAGMKVKDFDPANRRLRFYAPKTRTYHDTRIADVLVDELNSWLKIYWAEVSRFMTGEEFAEAYLFPSSTKGTGRYVPNMPYARLSPVVRRVLEDVGVSGTRLGSHTLRRSSASAFADALQEAEHSDPIGAAQRHLRHASRRTTEGYLSAEVKNKPYEQAIAGAFALETTEPNAVSGSMGAKVVPIEQGVELRERRSTTPVQAVESVPLTAVPSPVRDQRKRRSLRDLLGLRPLAEAQ